MEKKYLRIGNNNYSSPRDVFKTDKLEEVQNIRNMTEFDYPPTNKKNNFYPLEQLCFFTYDNLIKLCEDRKIEIDINKPLEINILDYQINKIVFGSKRCETLEDAYEYYVGAGFVDMNTFLRRNDISLPYNFYPLIAGDSNKGSSVGKNVSILNCIYRLDNYIEKYGEFGDDETFVYRGLTPPELVVVEHSLENDKKIRKHGEIYFREGLSGKAFTSSSKSIKEASRFVCKEGYDCCLLKFKIPSDIKFLDKSKYTTEEEYIIQRDIIFLNFEKIGKDENDVYIIECRIKPVPTKLEEFYKKDCPILKYYKS